MSNIGLLRFLIFYLVSSVVIFVNVQAGKKPGIRQRLTETGNDDDTAAEPSSSSAVCPKRGGLRRRLADGDPDDLDAAKTGTTENKLKGPLNQYLKQEWCTGKLKTPQVQSIAYKAMLQQAHGDGNPCNNRSLG
jgi:hypothetical protein